MQFSININATINTLKSEENLKLFSELKYLHLMIVACNNAGNLLVTLKQQKPLTPNIF